MIARPSSFEEECKVNAAKMSAMQDIREITLDWICKTARHKYTYNFSWLGQPIIQFSQDIKIDREIHNKLLITVAPAGYLRCIRD